MRGGAETVRIAAVWADTTRPYPVGQEGVQAKVDISFRVAHEPKTTPFVDTSAFISTCFKLACSLLSLVAHEITVP
jgi:hypothetical protein